MSKSKNTKLIALLNKNAMNIIKHQYRNSYAQEWRDENEIIWKKSGKTHRRQPLKKLGAIRDLKIHKQTSASSNYKSTDYIYVN